MKRILMLNYEYPPLGGGAAILTENVINELAQYPDFEIDLVVSSYQARHYIVQHSPNVTIHFLDIGEIGNLHYQSIFQLLKYSYIAYNYSKKLKKERKFDLIHAFFGIPNGVLAYFLRLPFIVTLQGSDVPFFNTRFYWLDVLFFRWISKFIWKKSQFTVSNSKGLRDLALKTSPSQRIEVIDNGVNVNKFKPIEKQIDRPLRIVSVGRLIVRKGVLELMSAAENLPIEVEIAGDGPLMDELLEISKKRGIKLTLHGAVSHDKIAKILQNSDVFVLASHYEGMSGAVLEAMATGLPIITTPVSGTEELIDSSNGIIVGINSPQEIKKAIEFYINNPQKMREHGKKSREKALAHSFQVVVSKYVELYTRTNAVQ